MNDGIATASASQVEIDPDALIAALDAAWDEFPEQVLRTCQAHRELVTPRLIEVLQEAVGLGREGDIREGNALLFALFLLAEFEAKEALPVVLDLFRLPEYVIDGLLGETLTAEGARLLAVFAGHDPDAIASLLADVTANDFARWEAASAFCQLVADGRMPREEAVGWLVAQLRRSVADEEFWGATVAICELGNLNPLEVQGEIKSAFDQNLVEESIIRWESFPRHLLVPDQAGSCPRLTDRRPSAVADTVEEMRDWYCFSEECRREQEAYEKRQAEYERQQAEREARIASQRRDAGWSDEADWEPLSSITVRNDAPRIGRNDPCPCGSGKKYKKCCLRATGEL